MHSNKIRAAMFQKGKMVNLISTGNLPSIIKRKDKEYNYHFTGNNPAAYFFKIF